MSKTLVALIILGIILSWKFILFPEKLDFTDRVKVLQGLSIVSPYKEVLSEYYFDNQRFPGTEEWSALKAQVEIDLSNSIVGSVRIAEVSPGTITLYYTNARDQSIDPQIAGKSLTLRPHEENGIVVWTCKGTVPQDYLPKPCR